MESQPEREMRRGDLGLVVGRFRGFNVCAHDNTLPTTGTVIDGLDNRRHGVVVAVHVLMVITIQAVSTCGFAAMSL